MLSALNESKEVAVGKCAIIDDAEHRADEITRETMRQLHTSFITPLDRDQIHHLINGLDNILGPHPGCCLRRGVVRHQKRDGRNNPLG